MLASPSIQEYRKQSAQTQSWTKFADTTVHCVVAIDLLVFGHITFPSPDNYSTIPHISLGLQALLG